MPGFASGYLGPPTPVYVYPALSMCSRYPPFAGIRPARFLNEFKLLNGFLSATPPLQI